MYRCLYLASSRSPSNAQICWKVWICSEVVFFYYFVLFNKLPFLFVFVLFFSLHLFVSIICFLRLFVFVPFNMLSSFVYYFIICLV